MNEFNHNELNTILSVNVHHYFQNYCQKITTIYTVLLFSLYFILFHFSWQSATYPNHFTTERMPVPTPENTGPDAAKRKIPIPNTSFIPIPKASSQQHSHYSDQAASGYIIRTTISWNTAVFQDNTMQVGKNVWTFQRYPMPP